MPASDPEIQALVDLLDDPDGDVQASVRARLTELGRDALPGLRSVREGAGPDLRDRIDRVVHELHLSDLERAWHAVVSSDPVDLERGAFLLALYRFPTLDIPAYRERLDALADAVRPRVNAVDGPRRALVLSRYLADDLGFDGNTESYYDPNNSYLNRVLDRRLGIPISLSVVFLLLADRLDLPACGVNMPAHFLVKYAGRDAELFLDPFNGGDPVTREECVRFLLKAGVRPLPKHFACAAPVDILLRMARNLIAIAQESEQTQTVDELSRLIAPYEETGDS